MLSSFPAAPSNLSDEIFSNSYSANKTNRNKMFFCENTSVTATSSYIT